MRKWRITGLSVLAALIVVGCSGGGRAPAAGSGARVVTVRAQARAPYGQRVENLVAAAEKLNARYEAEGKPTVVKVETNLFTGGWDEYRRNYMLAFQSGKAPDIWVTRHAELGWMARGEYVLPLDEAIAAESDTYGRLAPGLWDSVTVDGQRWGIPQNIEARLLFYRKDILRALGWSEEQIRSLPGQIRSGNFTLADMVDLAEEATSLSLVETGLLHRPQDGPEFSMMFIGFGGEVEDRRSGHLVLDRKPALAFLRWLGDAADRKVINPLNTQMDWTSVHKSFLNKKALFYIGGTHDWVNWQANSYHDELGKVTEEYLFEHVGYGLIPTPRPGGEGFTLAHPMVYVVNANTAEPEAVMDLLAAVTDPALQVSYAGATGQLAVMPEALEHPDYQANRYLHSLGYILEQSVSMPNHPDFVKYRVALFRAIQAVELGRMSPEEALRFFEEQLRTDIGDELEVR